MDELLSGLFDARLIDLKRGPFFGRTPAPVDRAELRAKRRIEGMLVGLAVGDALGLPTEYAYTPEQRQAEFGAIREHEHNPPDKRGCVSDDTQMSFWTLERLLASGRLDLDDLARCFVERRERIVGIGGTVRSGLGEQARRLQTGTPPLHLCPGSGRGDGSLMRYAPLLLPHLRSPSPRLWSDVTLASFLTHGHVVPLSATLAFAHLLWEVLRRPCGSVPPPEWWLDEYVSVAGQVERPPDEGAFHHPKITPTLYEGFRGGLCDFVDREVRTAWRRGLPLRVACSPLGFGSASDCLQAAPATLYVLMSHAGDFEEGVVAAVNETKDNDTIASIVGAILGALHGLGAVPRRWLDGITSSSVGPPEADRDVIDRLAGLAATTFL